MRGRGICREEDVGWGQLGIVGFGVVGMVFENEGSIRCVWDCLVKCGV